MRRWCSEILEKSPTAIAILKRAFNAGTEHMRGIGNQGAHAVKLYYGTEESKEGVRALNEKRKPDFRAARKRKPAEPKPKPKAKAKAKAKPKPKAKAKAKAKARKKKK